MDGTTGSCANGSTNGGRSPTTTSSPPTTRRTSPTGYWSTTRTANIRTTSTGTTRVRIAGAWVEPALEHVHGFFPDGAETLARYVREIDMGIDPDTGEDLERAAIEEPAFRTSFRIRAMADADPEDEQALDKVIQAADADYRHDVISGGDVARADWRNAAAYEWRRLMLEPHAPTDPVSDVSALAVIAVSMRYAPDATRAMIATDVLGPDLPTMGGLGHHRHPGTGRVRRHAHHGPGRTMARRHAGQGHAAADRDHAAWRILSPIQQNAPAPVEGHIYGLLGMLDHVEYLGRTGETGRMHAERALASTRPTASRPLCWTRPPPRTGPPDWRNSRTSRRAEGRHDSGRDGIYRYSISRPEDPEVRTDPSPGRICPAMRTRPARPRRHVNGNL